MNSYTFLVSDLVGRPGASRTEHFTEELPLEMDMARVASPLEIEVRFDATSREIVASGQASYDIVATCNRCLQDINESLTTRFSQVYVAEAAGQPDDESLPMDAHGHIDLESPIRDEVGLTLPLSPVCRAGCLGLCPTCGTDLNREPCEGHEDFSSSPFAVLQDFLDKD